MAKQLNVNLAFTADTAKAAANIKSLQQQLTELQKTGMSQSQSLGLTKDIREAITAVGQLKQSLANATTASGALDLTAFNQSIKSSWGNLDTLNTKLSALGPAGSQAFSQLAQSIATAEIPIRRSNQLLSEMATTIANTARWQLSSSLIHGFVGGLQQAYGYAKDLNESLNNIRIVTGQSTEQMAALAEKANKAARELSTRTTDYTNASLIYYQQGLNDKQVEERTRTTLKLANVTKQSAEEVSSQMTAIWNNFDDGTKKLEYYADAITKLGAKTASSSSEIAQGLSKFAAVADTIGLSYETAAASIATVVAETRQSADTVGNAFKSIFSRIQSLKLGETLEDGVGLTKYTQALETVGVQVLDINGELREADDILNDLGTRWQEISDTQKTALAQTVAGQRQYSQFIALVDNWDKVQQNVQIAEGSEGTLQEQADIYAESWEASAKRVKASAEAIYDALISDEFFIKLNDFLVGVLDRINDLIKGFGGLGGTLTALGAILTNVFSSKIASEIDRIAYNIKNTSKQARQEVADTQTQAQQILIQNSQAAASKATSTGSQQAQAQAVAYKEQASLIEQLRNNYDKYNAEQLKGVQAALDQNKALADQAIELGKIYDREKEIADSKASQYKVQALRSAQDKGISNPVLKAQDVSSSIQNYEQLTSSIASFEAMEGPLISITTALETNGEKVNSLQALYDTFGGSLDTLAARFPAAAAEVEELKQAFENLDSENPDSIKAVSDAYEALRIVVQGTGKEVTAAETAIRTALQNAGITGKEQDAIFNDITGTYKNLAERGVEVANSQVVVKQNVKATSQAMDEEANKASSLGTQMSAFASTVLSLSSVFNSLKSAVGALSEGDISGFMSALPSLIMSIGMLTNAVKGFQAANVGASLSTIPLIGNLWSMVSGFTAGIPSALGFAAAEGTATTGAIALQAALFEVVIPLALIAGAIAATIGAIKFFVNLIDDAFETPAEKAERLAQNVEDTKTALDNATTAAENLNQAFDAYSSAREALDNCKEGTDEWFTALNNVNDKVLELLNTYPQLAQYLTVGEHGELGLDEEGMQEFREQQQRNVNSMRVANLQAQTEQEGSKVSEEYGDLKQKVYDQLMVDWDGSVKEALTAAGINIEDGVDSIVDQLVNGGVSVTEALQGNGADLEAAIRQYAQENVYGGAGTGAWNKYNASDITEKDENGNYKMDLDTLKEGILSNASMGQTWEDVEAFIQTQMSGISDETKAAWASIDAAVDHYSSSLNALSGMQEAYGKAIGESIVYQNENLKNNPYLDKVAMASEKMFNTKYDSAKQEYQDKKISTDDFKEFIKLNDIQGFNDIEKGKKGGIKYKDDNGQEQTLSKDAIASMMAAADAQKFVAETAEGVAKKFEELETSGDKAKEGFVDFLAEGKFNRNGNDIKQAFEEQTLTHDNSRESAEALLDDMVGDGKDDKISDKTAQKYGYETKELMIDAFLKGLEEYDEQVEEARETGSSFLNKYYQAIVDGAKDSVDDLDISEQKQIGDLLKQSLDSGGYDGLKAMQDILMNTSDLSKTIEAFSGDDINWASLTLDDFKDRLASLGISIKDIKTDSLEDLFRTLKQIGEISFESATSTFKSLHDVIDGLEKGDTIEGEDFDVLKEKIDPSILDDFFNPMADGTYKLIGDATEFYNTVNAASLEEFKQGWQQESTKAAQAGSLLEKYGENGTGTKSVNFGESGNRELGLFDSAYGETDQGVYSYSKTLIEDQLAYLNLLNLTEEEQEQINTIEADLRDGKGLEADQQKTLIALMKNHKDQYGEVAEAQETANKNAEAYIKMLTSAAPDLQSLRDMFLEGDFEDTGKNWEDIAKTWKEIFGNDAQDSIKTIDDFKTAIADVDGFSAIDNSEQAWHKLKDSIQLTIDDLVDFKSIQQDISEEDFAEGMKQIASSASDIEELDQVIAMADGTGIDFTDTIIDLLNQSDMTTEEHIKAIIDQLRQGHGEASKLAQEISNLSAANDSEQTASEAKAERDTNYQEAKDANQAERDRINSSMSMGQEYKEKRNKELDDADRALDIQGGLDDIKDAANRTDDMFATEALDQFEQGLERIGNKADLTTMQIREIGQAAVSIATSSDLLSIDEQLGMIKQGFSNADGAIDPENLKAYADSVKDLIMDSDDLTLDQKLTTIKQELLDAGVPLEYIDEELVKIIADSEDMTVVDKLLTMQAVGLDLKESLDVVNNLINEILGNEQTTTIDKLQELHSLLDLGADQSTVAQGIADAVDSDKTMDIMQKQNMFNSMVNATPDTNINSAADYAHFEDQKQNIATDTEAYGDYLSGLEGTDFSSMDQLRDFASNIPDLSALEGAFNEADNIAEYASQFDRCADAVRQYNDALMQGKDTSEAIFNMDYLSRVEDAANKYGINGDRVQAMAEVYKETAEAGDNMNETLLGDVEVEGDAAESAERMAEAMTDAATRFVRFNDAIESLRKDGSKVQSTMKNINKAMAQTGQSAKEVAAGTEDYSKAMKDGQKMMSNLLGTEQKMLKENFVAKHFDKAMDAANGVEGAMDDLRQAFAESMAEDINMDGLSESTQQAIEDLGGLDGAMNDFLGRLSEMEDGATIDIDNEPFLQALIASQLAAGATADDIESLLSGLGIDADVEPFNQAMASAADTAGQAADSIGESGDAIVENASFDAEATSQTITNTDTKEAVGYDISTTPHTVSYSLPKIVSGGSVKHGKETLETAIVSGTSSASGSMDSVTVTPQPKEETETKEQTITGVKISNAHKSAGGKVSAGNSGGGGGGGGKGGGCFLAGTLITTNLGFKNIEEIKVGDIVLSYNEETQQNEYSEVLQTFIHDVNEEIYSLFIDNQFLYVTGIHRFLIKRNNLQKWIHASDLIVGDEVFYANGIWSTIDAIYVNKQHAIVYNFEVSNNHNYYVGMHQILAHNKGCFVAGTPITMRNYYKNIEEVQKGDIVLSYNEKTHQNEYSEVTDTMIHLVNENIYTLFIDDEEIVTTGIHKFLITRDKQTRWIHAHDLKIGDLVLYSDGTLHKIKNIDIKVEIKTVYNFTVSNNHNYYVGKNRILAHNRGSGGRNKAASTTTRKVSTGEHVDSAERYHVVLKDLSSLANKYNDVADAKDRAFGSKRVKAIQSEIDVLNSEIATIKKYRKEIDGYLKSDTNNLTKKTADDKDNANRKDAKYTSVKMTGTKTKSGNYKITSTESHATADASVKGFLGIDPIFNENGTITNLDDIKKAADKALNEVNDEYARDHKEDSELERKNFKSDKAWQAALDEEEKLQNKKNMIQAQYDQLYANIDQYYETIELKQQQITEQINKEIDLLKAKLEHTTYQVELKIDIDDSAIAVLESKIENLGDKARTAVDRISKMGEIMKKLSGDKVTEEYVDEKTGKTRTRIKSGGKIAATEFGFANVLNNIATNENQQTITDNNGEAHHFNNEGLNQKSQFLQGDKILEDFKANGVNAKDSIKTLVDNNILKENAELITQLNAYAQDELQHVKDIKNYREQIMEIMKSTWDEYSEDMDNIITKQDHLNTLMAGYYNVIDLVGRSRFYQDADKGRSMEANLDAQLKKQANQSLANIKKEKETIQKLIGAEKDADGKYVNPNSMTARRENAQAKADELKKQMDQNPNVANYNQLKQSREEWLQQVDYYDNVLNSMHDKLRETEENEQQAFEEALQANLDAFERALKRAGEVFSESMAKNAGDLEYLQEYMEMQQKIGEQTVASYEKAYQLRQMELEAQKSIDKATDPKIKRELLAIQDEITERAVDGKEATEYELKFLKQKLELKQAEAALDEAEKAKTQVSLTRDSEGNFGYVYTADDQAVQDAEKSYSDKIYEMQKANQEYIQSLTDQIAQVEMEYQQKMQEIMLNQNLTDEQKDARLTEVDAQFNQLHESLTSQMEMAFNAAQDIFGPYSENYASITGDLMATNLKYVGSFEETVYAQKAGYESLDEFTSTWKTSHEKYIEEARTAWSQYLADTNETFQAHGDVLADGSASVSSYADSVIEEAGNITTALGEGTEDEPGLSAQLDETAEKATTAFDEILTAVTTIEDDFVGSLGAMEEAATNLAEAIIEVQEQLSALEEMSGILEDVSNTLNNNNNNNNSSSSSSKTRTARKRGNKDLGYNKRGRAWRRKSRRYRRRHTTKIDGTRRIRLNTRQAKAVLTGRKGRKGYKRSEEYKALRAAAAKRRTSVSRLTRREQNRALRAAATRKVRRLLNSYKTVTIRYDTGGYTGDWEGSEGKFAMLHKKELILNQQDTQNILGAVGLIRDISNKIDLNALASSGAFSKIGASGLSNLNNELEQHVQIEANFPNATSREEIQAAFENLIGLASQYANRY